MTTTPTKTPTPSPIEAYDIHAMWRRHRAKVRAKNTRTWVGWIVIAVAAIGLWWLLSGRVIDPFWVSSPSAVGSRLVEMSSDSLVWRDMSVTLFETLGGFAIGTVLALILGLVMGVYTRIYDYVRPYFIALYTLPKITIGPLLILYFGIGYTMKVALAAIIAFFFVFYATVDSVRLTDRSLVGVVRVAGANNLQLLRTVYFPSALSGILSGMKIAMPYALQGALFGEILASNRGLGYRIQASASFFDVTGVYAGLILVTVLAVVVDQVFSAIVTRTQVWRGTDVSGAA